MFRLVLILALLLAPAAAQAGGYGPRPRNLPGNQPTLYVGHGPFGAVWSVRQGTGPGGTVHKRAVWLGPVWGVRLLERRVP